MDFRFIHFYPDLMSLYGSYGNAAVLKRYLERLGNTVTVETVGLGAPADLTGGDFLFMGAGTERAARAAMEDFSRFGAGVRAAAEAGAVMLFAGTAMELLGTSVTEADGTSYGGIDLAGFSTVHSERRMVEDVYGHTDLFPEAVVGFMNKCGTVTGVETPLLASVEFGIGNEGEKTPEGFHWKNVFASELTGPILVKNPRLLESLASALYARQGGALPEERAADSWAVRGYAVTEEQLRRRFVR
jgi:CobQ-like glutamine amidotransferase family enzyme|nr:hypothetical protein [uncultured Oscillibacter sp.]